MKIKKQSSINILIFIIIAIVVLIIAIFILYGLYHIGHNGGSGLNNTITKLRGNLNNQTNGI